MRTPILETERLILRPFKQADALEVFEGWESDPDVAGYMFWKSHNDIEKTKEWLTFEIGQIEKEDWYRFAIVLKETEELIGTGLIYYEEEVSGWEIGYNLGKKFWGKGYATEAMKAILSFAKEELCLTEIVGRYAKENPGSGKVMQKLGFRYEKDIPYVCNEGMVEREGIQCKLRMEQIKMEQVNPEELIDNDFRGIVYMVQNDIVLCEKESGFADLPNEIPNTSDTRFASASAGKVFVAVGILQLIEQGKLRLEDTLGEVLTIDLQSIDPDVTIRQLLTHTSGVPDYFDESIMDEYEDLWKDYPNYKIRNNDDLLPLFLHKPMMYPKGEKFQYNNSGYVLLAMVIETVTGMCFDEYLQANIFDVCDMKATGYYELDKLPAKCANHYIYCEETKDYRTNIFSVDVKGTGAGGAFITVKDIVNFWRGLRDGKLLSKEWTLEMLSKQSGDGKDEEEGYYGYGVWIIDNGDKNDIAYFQGCDPGVSFISEYNPVNNMISVLVSNYGDNVWGEMRKIRNNLY